MSGICSRHQHYKVGCRLCEAMAIKEFEEKWNNKYASDDVYSLAIKDVAREFYLDAYGKQEKELEACLKSFEGHHQATHDALYKCQENNKKLEAELERVEHKRGNLEKLLANDMAENKRLKEAIRMLRRGLREEADKVLEEKP